MLLSQMQQHMIRVWTDRYARYEAAKTYLGQLQQKYPFLPKTLAEGHVSYTYLCYSLDKVAEVCTAEEQQEAMDHLFTTHMVNIYDNSGIDGVDFEQTYTHIKLFYAQQNIIANLQKQLDSVKSSITRDTIETG